MNKNKTTNRNPANYHLYHALYGSFLADEDAIDKEVIVKVKDHKRKHDSDDDEDDDDDEGPSAGSNQGKSAKRRRPESAASESAQPPPKDDDQSLKKPRESNASAFPKQTSTALTSTDPLTHKSDAYAESETRAYHQRRQSGISPFRDSFIVSKKRSSDSSKKLKGPVAQCMASISYSVHDTGFMKWTSYSKSVQTSSAPIRQETIESPMQDETSLVQEQTIKSGNSSQNHIASTVINAKVVMEEQKKDDEVQTVILQQSILEAKRLNAPGKRVLISKESFALSCSFGSEFKFFVAFAAHKSFPIKLTRWKLKIKQNF
ncbi:hypothetical protein Tco_0266384 [Tanacetum coccineum]